MTRWCGIHQGDVQDTEAEIVSVTEAGSGPGGVAYACIDCIRKKGLVPPQARVFVGRRHAAPIAPERRS